MRRFASEVSEYAQFLQELKDLDAATGTFESIITARKPAPGKEATSEQLALWLRCMKPMASF